MNKLLVGLLCVTVLLCSVGAKGQSIGKVGNIEFYADSIGTADVYFYDGKWGKIDDTLHALNVVYYNLHKTEIQMSHLQEKHIAALRVISAMLNAASDKDKSHIPDHQKDLNVTFDELFRLSKLYP